MTAELLLSYFKIHLQLREGHSLLHMVWDFVWELSFFMSFLKKCAAAAVAKQNQKLWKGKREGELTETEMQYLFWPGTETLRNTVGGPTKSIM